MSDERLEALAALEQKQWAHWTRHMLGVIHPYLDHFSEDEGPVGEAIERWQRQIETPYADLPEDEKEFDREWAKTFIEAYEGIYVPSYAEEESEKGVRWAHEVAVDIVADLDSGPRLIEVMRMLLERAS